MFKRGFLASLPLIVSSFSVFAQTDFSGSWKFASQESVSGSLYCNGLPSEIKTTQSKTGMTLVLNSLLMVV